MKRLLIASPVRQNPTILKEFLTSLAELDTSGLRVDFAFVDDNDEAASRQLLRAFVPEGQLHLLEPSSPGSAYQKTEFTHLWTAGLVSRVATFKDRLIQLSRQEEYDGILLVDSDVLLHPRTLKQLIEANVDIIAEIFWTVFRTDQPELPQVWVQDSYTLHRQAEGEQLTDEEVVRRRREFLAMLHRPGVYPVGGLGACTLISERTIQVGVSFRKIPNLSFTGEDRHFCIRAGALGLNLYVDTHYPALHVYRELDLARVPAFKAGWAQRQAEVEALNACRQSVITWGTRHYETFADPVQALDGFAPQCRDILKLNDDLSPAVMRTARKFVRLHLLSGQVASLGDGAVAAESVVLQTGSEDGQSIRRFATVKAVLQRESDRWVVTEFEHSPRGLYPRTIPFIRKTRNNRVTLSLLVRNESGRHLAAMLRHAASYVDAAVVIDDASTDDTVAVCKELLAGLPHQIITLTESEFGVEHRLRRKQWELTLATDPDWILNLDADEIFEDRIRTEIRSLIDQDQFDVLGFRLYDLWNENHYREDAHWCAHTIYRPFLVRCNPNISDEWWEKPLHCGRFPEGIWQLPVNRSSLRIKHLGWSRAEDRLEKYQRYLRLDPDAKHGIPGQYDSILEPAPRLVRWTE